MMSLPRSLCGDGVEVVTADDGTDADELAEAQVIYGDFPLIASDLFPGTGPKRRQSVPQRGPRGILS